MSDGNGLGGINSNGSYRASSANGHGINSDSTHNSLNQLFQNGHTGNFAGTSRPATPPQSAPPETRAKATQPLPGRNVQSEEIPPYQSSGKQLASLFIEGQIVLSGTLTAFSPSSLLSLLNIQKQTGMLHMRNESAVGSIFVEKGEVFDARLDTVNGALALFQLFGWKSGEFLFEVNGSTPPKRTIEASLPVLQVRATLWLDNWNKYNPIIPTTSHRIGIAPEPRSEVMIEPYHWSILTRIVTAPMSITELANELKQDVMTITRIAADLVKMGVAIVYPPEKSDRIDSMPG